MIIIHTDGGARGNPGPAATGVYITKKDGTVVTRFGKKIGEATNNVAEYKAVVQAFSWLLKNKQHVNGPVSFLLDSELLVKQLSGKYKVKNQTLKELWYRVQQQKEQLGKEVTFSHVPRENNKEADYEVNKALDNKSSF